ncbi:MAG: hypothetical protein LUC92_01715 [Clostridiales bacterium]|nr:hypothetical protein [Clostridiales bacterium]
MKAYKGFDKNLSCRGFRYEVGKEYKEAEAELCKSGFHSCINPLDVLYYYSPVDRHGNLNRYCEVDIPQNSVGGGNDSKVATEKIKIKSEIGLCGLVERLAKFAIFS